MTIKGANGESYDVTGSGQGIYNTIGASAGILSLLGGNGNLLGGLFGNNNHGVCSDNTPVTRYEAQQMDVIAAKDAEIARLQADQATDKKLVEVFNAINSKANDNRDRIDLLAKEMSDKLTAEREARLISEGQQQVFNQSVTGGMATVNQQIAQLNSIVSNITTNVVPSRKVCDTGCCGCN